MGLKVGLGCASPAHAELFSCIVNPISPPATTAIFNVLDFASSFPPLYFSLSVPPQFVSAKSSRTIKESGLKTKHWLINLKPPNKASLTVRWRSVRG